MQSTTESPAPAARRLLTATQVAETLGCSRSYVHILTARGQLPSPVYLDERAHPRWWSDEIAAALDSRRAIPAADMAARRERARAKARASVKARQRSKLAGVAS